MSEYEDPATVDWALQVMRLWAESIAAYASGDYFLGAAFMEDANRLTAMGPIRVPYSFDDFPEYRVDIDAMQAMATTPIIKTWPILYEVAEEEEKRIPEKNPLPREEVPPPSAIARMKCPQCARRNPLPNLGGFECWWCGNRWEAR